MAAGEGYGHIKVQKRKQTLSKGHIVSKVGVLFNLNIAETTGATFWAKVEGFKYSLIALWLCKYKVVHSKVLKYIY